jgi:glutamate racemase
VSQPITAPPASKTKSKSAIGVFDSGVGGLSVLRAVRRELPNEQLVYIADQAHVPYGPRQLEEVRTFAVGITHFLLSQPVKLIVVACNTASAAALHYLRDQFPGIPFVGMEPAVKPAAEHTQSGAVGVLATPATFQGELYSSVIERFAYDVNVYQDTCPGLVEFIEAGDLQGTPATAILKQAIDPMLEKGIDTIVLGCTHYPFVIPQIQHIAGPGVRVIDPAPAVARQTRRVLVGGNLLADGEDSPEVHFYTSGDQQRFEELAALLFGETGKVGKICWGAGEMKPCQE